MTSAASRRLFISFPKEAVRLRVIGQKVLLLMPMDLVKYWLYRHFIFLSNFYI